MLFPEDRAAPELAHEVVHVRLKELQVERPRQWGGCWLCGELWQQLKLDDFWRERLGVSREGTDWLDVLKTLVNYRLIDPGSEWRLHREWYERSAMADLLGRGGEGIELQSLYRCQDKLLAHKAALLSFLKERWQDLFQAEFEVLLYDLTSTYFECDPPASGKRRFGYSRDKRPDCVQVIIALVVTPEGLPLAYEVMAGNTSEKTTLKGFLEKIEQQYGRAKRTWVMDRGIPTEEVLKEMREAPSPVAYLVGTPRGRLNKLEKQFLQLPWAKVKEAVEVKLLARESELYILARSQGRRQKDRAIRRRRLKRLWQRLHELQGQELTRDELLLKLGAAKAEAGRAYRLVEVRVPAAEQPVNAETFTFALRKDKLRQTLRREGHYLLRWNSFRGRSGPAVAARCSAHRDRSGLSGSEERLGHPAPLSPEGLPHRGACLHLVPSVLSLRHAPAALAGSGAGADSASRDGEDVLSADGGCAGADDRWAVADLAAIHATGEGPLDASPSIAPTTTGSTSAEDHPTGHGICRRSESLVVKTF